MTATFEAPGLTADWLNGWLAAIGVTVAVPGVALSWSDEGVPFAVFHCDEDEVDLVAAAAEALPRTALLEQSVIARRREELAEFPRNVTLDIYRERAMVERKLRTFELAASVSDLRVDADLDSLDHGPFDPPAPKGETLWSRALKCAREAPEETGAREEAVRQTLAGVGRRVKANGLGFDPRRLPSSVQGSGAQGDNYADPVVELLCFLGLALFPTRGNGRHIRQRGWRDRATQRGAFQWLAWRPALDRWAIDAILDIAKPTPRDVIARFGLVPYQPTGSSDVTRAYFAERLA